MTTVQDILYDSRALINQYNEDGIVIPSSDVAQQEVNGIRFINMALREIYRFTRYYKTMLFNQAPTEAQYESGKWIERALPSDFTSLEQIVMDDEYRDQVVQYKIEEFNKLYLPVTVSGDIKVIYTPKLTTLINMTDVLPNNNQIAEQFIVYYVAAKLAMEDNPAATSFFDETAKQLKFEAMKPNLSGVINIKSVYSMC